MDFALVDRVPGEDVLAEFSRLVFLACRAIAFAFVTKVEIDWKEGIVVVYLNSMWVSSFTKDRRGKFGNACGCYST